MLESAEPNPPSMPTVSFITASGLTYSSSILSVTRMPLVASSALKCRDLFLYALLIGRQRIDKVVEGRAYKTADDQQNGDHACHHDQNRNDGGNAFPLEPEYRRRPEHGKENSDQEGHQDRLRLVDAPDDDHERGHDDEEADSPL